MSDLLGLALVIQWFNGIIDDEYAFAFQQYIRWTSIDGDWLNDWLTHIDPIWRPIAESLGHVLSYMLF